MIARRIVTNLGVCGLSVVLACTKQLGDEDDTSPHQDSSEDVIHTDASGGDTHGTGMGGDDDDDVVGSDDDDDSSQSTATSSTTSTTGSDPATTTGNTTSTGSSDPTQTSSNETTATSSEDSSEPQTTDDTTTTMCPELSVAFNPVIPTVMLVVDQSGSMAWDLNDDTSRWKAMRDALVDGAEALIPQFESEIRFGMALYTGDNSTCPIFDSVPSALNNFSAIKGKLDSKNPLAGTPTGESFEMALDLMNDDFTEGPRVFILVTDGEPATCAALNVYNGQDESLAAVGDAYSSGFKTYVIGVGSDVGKEHLQQLANVGQGVAAGAGDADDVDVYQAKDPEALADAFKTIINGVRPCSFTLEQGIKPGFEDEGTLTIDGVTLTLNDANGWRVNNPTEIEILGNACKEIQEGSVDIHIEFPCEAIEAG